MRISEHSPSLPSRPSTPIRISLRRLLLDDRPVSGVVHNLVPCAVVRTEVVLDSCVGMSGSDRAERVIACQMMMKFHSLTFLTGSGMGLDQETCL